MKVIWNMDATLQLSTSKTVDVTDSPAILFSGDNAPETAQLEIDLVPEEVHDNECEVDDSGSQSENGSSRDSGTEKDEKNHEKNRTSPDKAMILQLFDDGKSRRQIAKIASISAKTVSKILNSSGVVQSPAKRGRKSVLTAKEECALVQFLLQLDKANLNWTWPLLHKLLEIITRKKSIPPLSGYKKIFSSKWLVGFTHRHRKQISLRVVDYGLNGQMQNKQKNHPGRMENVSAMISELLSAMGISETAGTVQEVQEMWASHLESPKTRKVFALKGRKNVRLTIRLPNSQPGGPIKRVRKPKPPPVIAHQPTIVYVQHPVNQDAVRLALNAFLVAGYSEEDGKKILRDLNVPVE